MKITRKNDLESGKRWRLVASASHCTIIRVEDWVNRNYRKDKGTTVYYMIDGERNIKQKSLEDFVYMYEPT
jgi:hypothetical protein